MNTESSTAVGAGRYSRGLGARDGNRLAPLVARNALKSMHKRIRRRLASLLRWRVQAEPQGRSAGHARGHHGRLGRRDVDGARTFVTGDTLERLRQ